MNGVSDILGLFEGKFLAIEVKTPKNRVRPAHQKNFIKRINKGGGIAFFATSVDEVKEKLWTLKHSSENE